MLAPSTAGHHRAGDTGHHHLLHLGDAGVAPEGAVHPEQPVQHQARRHRDQGKDQGVVELAVGPGEALEPECVQQERRRRIRMASMANRWRLRRERARRVSIAVPICSIRHKCVRVADFLTGLTIERASEVRGGYYGRGPHRMGAGRGNS